MEDPIGALERWRTTAPTRVPVADVRTDAALQPRDERLVQARDRLKVADLSAEQVARLHGVLATSTSADLDPILLADVDSALFVVDGHHRLKAYKRANREDIPARILQASREAAIVISKLVNLGGVKLPMHSEQARDAAWQYLAHITKRGARGLPKGESLRVIAGRFGITADTTHRMVKMLPFVSPSEYGEEARDPGTDWPRWKYVRGAAQKGLWNALSPAQQLNWKAEKCAAQIAKLRDKFGADAFAAGVGVLLRDAATAPDGATAKQLRQWAEIERDGDASADF